MSPASPVHVASANDTSLATMHAREKMHAALTHVFEVFMGLYYIIY